jgi:hydroxyacyl-ACP dehydratase HTD2-like protein with hotdog domain
MCKTRLHSTSMPPHTQCLSRIARTPLHRTQWRRLTCRQYSSTAADDPPWFQQLRSEMLSRDATASREYIADTTEHKLIDTLSTSLPAEWLPRLPASNAQIPMGHHLVWFNTSMPVDQLLPDGTDPLQSPGAPWVRRMWAGGSLQLKPELYYDTETGFAANSTMVCAERIQDVQLRGHDEAAKIFVTIERRFTRLDTLMAKHEKPLAHISKGMVRGMGPHWHFQQQLEEQEWGDAVLKEYRNLVFLKERTPAELSAIEAGQMASLKYMKCTFSTLPLQ